MNFSRELVSGVAKFFPEALFYKETKEKIIALTIDDAPCAQDPQDWGTRLILEAIADHNRKYNQLEPARATFFIISSHIEGNPAIIREIIAHGHEVANHGVIDTTHALLTPQQFEQQLREAHEKLLDLSKQDAIHWYRPGRGLYNQQMVQTITNLTAPDHYDLKLVLASMIPFDTFTLVNHPQLTAIYAKQMVFPGAILVFHANSLKVAQNTALVLEIILKYLRQLNYRIVTVSALFAN